jgi:Do/DeqQ family serine protease
VTPAVVHIKSTKVQQVHRGPYGGTPDQDLYGNDLFRYFFGPRDHFETPDPQRRGPSPRVGSGSGVLISEDGYIVTNNHVIDRADQIEVVMDDRRSFKAELVGADPNTDLALLKIDASDLYWVPMGNSDDVKLGQWVLAVGNPYNLTSTVTAGIISAKGRNLGILGNQRYRIESFLQTDAALNHGNSGGALVNTEGELIGITSAIVSATGEYSGNSFAIPVEIVKKVVADLKEFGRVQRAILGVTITDVTSELVKEENLGSIEGVYISDITQGGAAENAGLKPGDVILQINDREVNSVSELQEQFSRYRPGDRVKIMVKRNRKVKPYDIVLRNLEGGIEIIERSEYVLGARFTEISNREKEQYGISYGIKISEIQEGRLSNLGFKEGYIIMSINNDRVDDVDDIRRIETSGDRINSIQGITPDGMQYSYRFR